MGAITNSYYLDLRHSTLSWDHNMILLIVGCTCGSQRVTCSIVCSLLTVTLNINFSVCTITRFIELHRRRFVGNMEKPSSSSSWVCTVFTQFCLCFALYLVLHVPHSHKLKTKTRSLDIYFISVRGGLRPLHQQTHLLRQMERAAKAYKASFVVNISELGEDDPLMQNGTQRFRSLQVPWYTTRVSKGLEGGYFLKHINMPFGKTLDIIGVDTGSLQDIMHTGSTTGAESKQLHWLTRTLGATNSNWRIVFGFHPLVICKENKDQIETDQIYESLHHIFMQFGVNAYLSKVGCTEYALEGGVAYIGNPGLAEEPYLASGFGEKMVNGFLLHRVSSLEIVTYFVASSGEVVYKSVLQHRGRDVM